MEINNGTTTFNTTMNLGGGSLVVPSDLTAGTDGQVLTVNNSGDVYWGDPTATKISVVANSNNTFQPVIFASGTGTGSEAPSLYSDSGIAYNKHQIALKN